MNSKYLKFEPDLIIEVTTVCDRRCIGCYAPNVVSKDNPLKLYSDHPEFFLSIDHLKLGLDNTNLSHLKTISLRGGEPSRHPELPQILRVLNDLTQATLVIETHGRWIADTSDYFELLNSLSETGSVVKISFDRMHALSYLNLLKITQTLDDHKVKWCIAITEADEAAFQKTRESCAWIPARQIIFQKKAEDISQLIRPKAGVMQVNGRINSVVTTKQVFKPIEAAI